MSMREMHTPRIHTSDAVAEDAGARINKLLRQYAESEVLLLLSGGSACAVLEYIDAALCGERVTISVLDERYTYESVHQNTHHLLQTTFWHAAEKTGVHLIDPRPQQGETLEACGKRFDVALKHWHVTHHNGVVIATMGIGVDGHTAGVLPMPHNSDLFSALFEKRGCCAVGYVHSTTDNPHRERVTTTLAYLRTHVQHAIVYVVGEQKKAALRAAVQGAVDVATTPASVLQQIQGMEVVTTLSTDKDG
jgi:6-phosphogluconolactonase/glucosamine-6-phosphate isomerase/deaminase